MEATTGTATGAQGAGAAAAGTGSAVERGPRGGRVGVGDKVEARFQAGAEWFPAMVTKVCCVDELRGPTSFQTVVVQYRVWKNHAAESSLGS